jgi:hypothetical protein
MNAPGRSGLFLVGLTLLAGCAATDATVMHCPPGPAAGPASPAETPEWRTAGPPRASSTLGTGVGLPTGSPDLPGPARGPIGGAPGPSLPRASTEPVPLC